MWKRAWQGLDSPRGGLSKSSLEVCQKRLKVRDYSKNIVADVENHVEEALTRACQGLADGFFRVFLRESRKAPKISRFQK